MSLSVTLTALPGVPDIQDGDNLSAIFADCLSKADLPLRDGDILCVAQKVFSKAEGCIIPLASVTPSPEALRYGEELNKDPVRSRWSCAKAPASCVRSNAPTRARGR